MIVYLEKSAKTCIKKSKMCRVLMSGPIALFYFYLRLKIWLIPDKKYIIKHYKRVFHQVPNLEQPQTMNEYINYRKLYDKNPLLTLCSDKYLVRQYVAEKIGDQYLIPLLAASDDVFSINFDLLPKSFVAKVNHGSGQNFIVKDKHKVEIPEMQIMLHYWMKRSHYYNNREWQYKDIKPMVIIEEMLFDESGDVPKDYKFHTFNGKVEMIQIDSERFSDHKRIFYSKDWEKQDFMWVPVFEDGQPKYKEADEQQKPAHLAQMLDIVEKLAEDFKYVRVDLYYANQKIYFGELTFTHENGLAKFFPEKYDAYFGSKLLEVP